MRKSMIVSAFIIGSSLIVPAHANPVVAVAKPAAELGWTVVKGIATGVGTFLGLTAAQEAKASWWDGKPKERTWNDYWAGK